MLTTLRDQYRIKGDSGRVYGYDRAIRGLKQHPTRIETREQALTVPGIGESIADKITEFRTTGQLAILANTADRDRVIKLFMEIDQVGPVTANQWYEAGYRQLADIPTNRLTPGQALSMRYHAELQQRIPRAEIDALNELLSGCPGQPVICGSYRRGLPTSGDVDILLMGSKGSDVLQTFLECLNTRAARNIFTGVLAMGEKKLLGIAQLIPNGLHRRVDIEVATPDQYPFTLLYFTGSAALNVYMRGRAQQMGWTLNEKDMVSVDGQFRLPVTEESQIFQFLQMPYRTPAERETV